MHPMANTSASHHLCRMMIIFASFWVRAATLTQIVHSANDFPNEMSASNVSDGLLDVSTVRGGSEKLYDKLSTQIQDIQSQLAAKRGKEAAAVAKQKAEYEDKLKMQKSEIVNAERMNNRAKNEIEQIRRTNVALRMQATKMAGACEKVRMHMEQLQSNITTAKDFIQNTLNGSERLLNASEVQIMKDLDLQDTMAQRQLARERSMHAIGMLQLGSQKAAEPSRLVQGLLVDLEDFSKQEEATATGLKEMFESRHRAGMQKLQELNDEYKQLTAAKESEIQVQGKLSVAVKHLEKTYVELVRRRQALRNFVHNLDTRNAAA